MFRAKTPSKMRHMWLILEQATRRLASHCVSASSAPYRMPITARIAATTESVRIACGNMGSTMRRKPYTPILETTPASTIVVGVADSVYTSDTQLWNVDNVDLM